MEQRPPNVFRLCYPGTPSDSIQIDPELRAAMPPLSKPEIVRLHRSLDARGCLYPIICWEGHEILVDGLHRLLYHRDRGKPYPVIDLPFPGRADVLDFIRGEALARRNMAELGIAYYSGLFYIQNIAQGQRNDLTCGNVGHKLAASEALPPDGEESVTCGNAGHKSVDSVSRRPTTAERLSEELQIAERTLRNDAATARSIDTIVANTCPEALSLMLARGSRVSRNMVRQVARQSEAEQRAFIDQLKAHNGQVPTVSKGARPKEIRVPLVINVMAWMLRRHLRPEECLRLSSLLVEPEAAASSP